MADLKTGDTKDLECLEGASNAVLLKAIREDDIEAARTTLQAGADPNQLASTSEGVRLCELSTSSAMTTLLREYGANIEEVQDEVEDEDELDAFAELYVSGDETALSDITQELFEQGRARRFGISNPESMDIPFWTAMVEAGCEAYTARKKYKDKLSFYRNPIWCFYRMGESRTKLPDGRVIVIAGEHEDYYDPDFCIYNDVIVFHADSTRQNPKFTIYGYPDDVFPPTDFHSATYIPDQNAIYIIGRLGYGNKKDQLDQTPVYLLDCETWKIEKIVTTGDGPGHIYRHNGTLDGQEIVVESYPANKATYGGAERRIISDGETKRIDVRPEESWRLSLQTMVWRKAV